MFFRKKKFSVRSFKGVHIKPAMMDEVHTMMAARRAQRLALDEQATDRIGRATTYANKQNGTE